MEQYNRKKVFSQCPLFRGLSDIQQEFIVAQIFAREKEYEKGEVIFQTGEKIWEFGIIMRGKVTVIKEDYNGNQVILAHLEMGDIFAEAFVFSSEIMTVTVMAESDCEILFLDQRQVLSVPELTENLLRIFAGKNVFLTERIEHLSRRTMKEKVLSYLADCARKAGSNRFSVPFNRQEMADYLAVDRSALSAVLSKLKKEEKIDYWKNEFYLPDE